LRSFIVGVGSLQERRDVLGLVGIIIELGKGSEGRVGVIQIDRSICLLRLAFVNIVVVALSISSTQIKLDMRLAIK
jgi:hypothetical protein